MRAVADKWFSSLKLGLLKEKGRDVSLFPGGGAGKSALVRALE